MMIRRRDFWSVRCGCVRLRVQFDVDGFLGKMYAELPLPQLVAKEKKYAQEIKSLDSEMQTLVYENYNKFISATDTIRKMKSQVDGMEEEMARLVENMSTISNLSAGITDTLSERRQRICKLSDSHSLLKKLQFLFELPARLKQCVDMESYKQAVTYYSRASHILDQYRDMDSFRGIYTECAEIMDGQKTKLQEKVRAVP